MGGESWRNRDELDASLCANRDVPSSIVKESPRRKEFSVDSTYLVREYGKRLLLGSPGLVRALRPCRGDGEVLALPYNTNSDEIYSPHQAAADTTG